MGMASAEGISRPHDTLTLILSEFICLDLIICGYLPLVFVMLSCLFIDALWSPAGKGLTLWLLFVMFNFVLSLSHVVSWVRGGT